MLTNCLKELKPTLLKRLMQQTSPACLVLDGGLGTSVTLQDEEERWDSPRLMADPRVRKEIKRVHRKFLESGVDILTTNTFQMCVSGYSLDKATGKYDLRDTFASDNFAEFSLEGVAVANEAIDEFMAGKNETVQRPLIALSVATFISVASLDRPSTANRLPQEGIPDLRLPGYGFEDHLIKSYLRARLDNKMLVEAAKSGVAVIAIETVGDLLEVQIICEVLAEKAETLREGNLSTWIALTCRDETFLDTGDTVAEAVALMAQSEFVTGIGINCTEPEYILPLIETIKKVLAEKCVEEKIIVIYPNSGETYYGEIEDEDVVDSWKKPKELQGWHFEEAAVEWVKAGAGVVGGCCRITDVDITNFKKRLLDLV